MELKDKIVELLGESEPLKGGQIAESLGVEKKEEDLFSKKMFLFS